jgi:flagellar protein FlaC
VSIKLKMGKGEDESVDESDDDSSPKTEESSEEPKNDEEDESEEKKNADDLRKVIKVNEKKEEKSTEEKKQEDKKTEPPKPSPKKVANGEPSSREELEQKRAILQSIKDFDFQIKKNQEEITGLNKKLESVTKDLDDLVSLYEIVSEQMNPFVGLSKVTKKRIDALENFTKEIEDLNNRMGDLESFAEQAGANIQSIKEHKQDSAPGESGYSPRGRDLSNDDLDEIIERSFKALSLDERIDNAIDEFIENLKEENKN